jgi:hypothetical protein
VNKRIAVVGLPFFGRKVAAELRKAGLRARFVERGQRSVPATARMLRALAQADLVYGIGVSATRNSPMDLLLRARKRVLIHWVGTDVLHAAEAQRLGRLSPRVARGASHWADAPWLVEELSAIGISAEEHLLPTPVALGEPLPLPPEFRVLLYFPPHAHAAYDMDGTFEAVRALPDVPFTLVGGVTPPAQLPNLCDRGTVSFDGMRSVYAECSVFLRLVHHDGMSHTVLEALSLGRHVLWSYPLSGVRRVTDTASAVQAITQLRSEHEAGTLAWNQAGAAIVRQRYQHQTVLQSARRRISELLEG